MEIDIKWWSAITVLVISLIAFLVIDGNKQIKNIEVCRDMRIRPFAQQFFNWTGIVELTNKGAYQPSCL